MDMRALFLQPCYGECTLKTDSTSQFWRTFFQPENSLSYEYSGGLTGSMAGKNPYIDMTANTGVVDMIISGNLGIIEYCVFGEYDSIISVDLSDFWNAKILEIIQSSLTSIDVSNNKKLEKITLTKCDISYIDLSVNNSLKTLILLETKITSIIFPTSSKINFLDLTLCTVISSTELDAIIIDLDNTGVTDGFFGLPTATRTSASDTAYNSLISKNWRIQ